MGDVLAQVTIPHDSNLPKDAVVNTWHFWVSGNPRTANGADMSTPFPTWCFNAVKKFYNPPTGAGPGDSISAAYNPAGGRFKLYDLGDAQPRIPFLDVAMDLGSGSGAAPLPEEVAVCLSYHTAFVSGEPKARRRGRIFLGPFTTSVLNLDIGNTIVDPTFVALIRTRAIDLMDDSSDQAYWSVFSKVDNAGRAVTGGWVDNAFDIQRRRGRAAASRSVFGV